MALAAPRSLNEPIGWRFSSFSQISDGAPSTSRRTSGVRIEAPRSRSRAARTSSRVGAASGVGMAVLLGSLSALPAAPARSRALAQRGRGVPRPVSTARRWTWRAAARSSTASPSDSKRVISSLDLAALDAPGDEVAELARDVRLRHRPLGDRLEEVAGLGEGRLARVDEEAGAGDRRGVEARAPWGRRSRRR